MTEIVLTLPLPSARNTSSDRHWSVRHRKKKQYYSAADLATLKVKFPPAPFGYVAASAVVYPRGRNDEDNLFARLKSVQDWCKSRGIVVDDNPPRWKWAGIPDQVVQRKKPAYLVLTLRSVDPAAAPTSGG